jgi:hypothetical protein
LADPAVVADETAHHRGATIRQADCIAGQMSWPEL